MFLVFQEGTFRLGVSFRGFILAYQMDPLVVFFASDPFFFLQVQVEDDWSDDAPWTERPGGSVIPLGPFQYFLGCNTSKCYVNIWIMIYKSIL